MAHVQALQHAQLRRQGFVEGNGNPFPALPDKSSPFRALGVGSLGVSVTPEQLRQKCRRVAPWRSKGVDADRGEEQPCLATDAL